MGLAGLAGLAAALLAAGCAGGSAPVRPAARTPAGGAVTASRGQPVPRPARRPRRPHRSRRPHRARRPRPDPGRRPQTDRLPPAHSPLLAAEIRALWRGVRRGSLRAALPAFFPEGAYAQVKAIADPQADYEDRLLVEYRLDLEAVRGLLGAGARSAHLIGVRVPEANAHWVPPGVCANRVGYWEVPNARVVYRTGTGPASFGIASMISWRGVWYVVHLGAVVRAGPGGVVDDPSAGPGVSAPSSTC